MKILFIVDSLTEHEARRGMPLLDKAGAEFDFWLNRTCRLQREDVYTHAFIPEYVKNDPSDEQVADATGSLMSELEAVYPDIVVPFGTRALRYFFGPDADMQHMHGLAHHDGVRTVFPIMHPAGVQYDLMALGFEQLGRFLRGEITHHEIDTAPVYYHEHRDAELCGFDIRWGCDMWGIIAIDTEGSAENPWCLTFSMEDRIAGLIRADQPQTLGCFQRQINEVTAMGGKVVMHYAPHDLRVLEKMGIIVPPASVLDTMQLAYIAGRLPQGLKALAYRLCGIKMREYLDLMVEHDRRVGTEWLDAILTQPEYLSILAEPPKRKRGDPKPPELSAEAKEFRRHAKGLLRFAQSPSKDSLQDRWGRSVLSERLNLPGFMPRATLDDVPFEEVLHYACTDADATRRVFFKLREYFD